MADSTNLDRPAPDSPAFDRNLARFAVIDPGRRRMLVALAHGKAMSPSQLKTIIGSTVEGAFKQLENLRAAGLVKRKEDPTDDRRWLYELDPCMPVKVTPTGKVIDFGFIVLPVR